MLASSVRQFEGELKRMLLFSGDSYAAVNRHYNDLQEQSLKQCNELITEPEYMFNNLVLRIGERFSLLGNTAVEQAAARQWIQYRITRLGSLADKRELEEVLQELDVYLKEHTYLTGTQFGVADLLLYCNALLYQHLQVEVTSQRLPYRHSNIVRWFDQVQHHYHQHSNDHSYLTVITNANISSTVTQ